jgi:antitoxin component YwqK of YwqJK toxin-antitoxin module
MRKHINIHFSLLLTLALFSVMGMLAAQGSTDEYELVNTFVLPKIAVPIGEITQENEVWLKDGTLFTGIAYERFENGNLSRVVSLLRGLQQGPMYLWYPDGTPQMSANYRQGRLNGRFLGWYRHGGVIYDMVINQCGFAGDYLSREDSQESDDFFEPEGDANEPGDGN